jgi:hypothetical protein
MWVTPPDITPYLSAACPTHNLGCREATPITVTREKVDTTRKPMDIQMQIHQKRTQRISFGKSSTSTDHIRQLRFDIRERAATRTSTRKASPAICVHEPMLETSSATPADRTLSGPLPPVSRRSLDSLFPQRDTRRTRYDAPHHQPTTWRLCAGRAAARQSMCDPLLAPVTIDVSEPVLLKAATS